MARKWRPEDEKAIAEVRRRLQTELSSCPQFPEVVGDRRILRFLKGKQMKLDEAIPLIQDFLKWRKENNVDDIRQDIVYGGKNTPFKFPKGKTILKLAPQIVITSNSVDKQGRPLAMELFNFNPKEVFKAIKIEDFLLFLTYALEYRVLVMEQMAHEYEQKYLKDHPDPSTQKDGWGIVLLDFTIRDLKGVGMAHLSSDGRAIVGAALKLGYNNYSEYLGKSHMVNVPWIFNSMWYFVKTLLDASTLAKINMCGADYMDHLLKDMTIDNIPAVLGGKFQLYNEPFEFDVSPSGTLYYPGSETECLPYLERRKKFEKNDKEEYCYYWGGVTPPNSIYVTNANDSTRTNVGSIKERSEEEEGPARKKSEHISLRTETKETVSPSSPKRKPDVTEILPSSAVVSETTLKNNTEAKTEETVATHNAASSSSSYSFIKMKQDFGRYWKIVFQFLLFCCKENPFLSVLAVLFIGFVLNFHPHIAKSIVPSIVGCYLFVYFTAWSTPASFPLLSEIYV